MAGSTEVFSSLKVNNCLSKPPSKHLINAHNCIFHQNMRNLSSSSSSSSSSISNFSSYKGRAMRLKKKIVTKPMAALALVADENKKNVVEEEGSLKFNVTAIVTVRYDAMEHMKEMMFQWLSPYSHSTGPTQRDSGVVLQLVSTDLDLKTREPKVSSEAILDWSKSSNRGVDRASYKVEFMVDSNFGLPGAVTVINKCEKEFYLESITVQEIVHFACKSWVSPHKLNCEKRIFFIDKACLPGETPEGLKKFREIELRQLRGDGEGIRKLGDRIYDYDIYNDLGNPDKGIEYTRPIFGGKKHPHPRRCRTRRPPAHSDVNTESPVKDFMTTYVPRDESFGKAKRETLDLGILKGLHRNMIPFVTNKVTGCSVLKGISDFHDLCKEKSLPNVFSKLQESVEEFFKFEHPKVMSGDSSFCLRDDEFGRQMLAGINPLSIERLKEFPPKSKLDPSIYGPQDSTIKEEDITGHLNGITVQQAIEDSKLFVLDYHDAYLPILECINAAEDRKAYATRTILFLTPTGTLKPIAIELSLPPGNPNSPSTNQVLTPPVDATTNWLWQLAKAHVCSNDAGVHQLVHHWLRTHACMEPFIIAAHRQLSKMHPVFKLLHPHMRYTMQINASAREALINAGGIIESDFSVGKHCMEICSAAYRDWWRFDMEGLPADLIRRGMAEADPTEPHGLRLLIKDYPYATDGLLIWSAIERLVDRFVDYYYPEASAVCSDRELQAWYKEAIDVGHADHRNASWWPKLSSPCDLASILTTLIWISSAQHAAVNFGQYPYGGYVPNRPPLMRRLLPKENDADYKNFVADPQGYFLSSLPSLFQATKYMAVIDILSTHSADEEYLGERKDLSTWSGDAEVIDAFYKFSMEIKEIEKEIEKRNSNPNLRNRCGAGIPPFELLAPSSGPGITCRGVPNSISV